jgi:ABC-type cobalamin/Fe3+-siderophores transport system ATPase subunit
MDFVILPANTTPPPSNSRGYLIEDNWDDWFKYKTQYTLIVFDEAGKRYEPGAVKIGRGGLLPGRVAAPGTRTPTITRTFEALDTTFFSLGQSETYYETLASLPSPLGDQIFTALRDCIFDSAVFEAFQGETSMVESLLRYINEDMVAKFSRLARGDAALTSFSFSYTIRPERPGVPDAELSFEVAPNAFPPTNLHVLIGRNGAGKTRCLEGMISHLIDSREEMHSSGVFAEKSGRGYANFSGLVHITFSAFDRFIEPPEKEKRGLRFKHVGLPVSPTKRVIKELADEFLASLAHCRSAPRLARWRSAVEVLENDPLFQERRISELVDIDDESWRKRTEKTFSRLSSGHANVLLTITRLVELVDEKTLVLMDEPESHLHPPLLSAFVRALTNLLISRNGVALLATHSPVVLQEVPSSCVHILQRSGATSRAERPSAETFGENVGTLTREVFGLEVAGTGFHKMLQSAAAVPGATYESVINQFSGQLGSEGRAILHTLLAGRRS